MGSFFSSGVLSGKLRPWLRDDGKSRLFTLRLKNVDNPLDADSLWEARTGGDRDVQDTRSGRYDLRLKQALDIHRYITTTYKGGAPIPRTSVFSDVVVWIPESYWRDSDIEGGEALFLMTERFRYEHQRIFGADEWFQRRPPNYSIMPHAGLAKDEVACQFGLGVFLPNANDVQSANLRLVKQQQEPGGLRDWIFYEREKDADGKDIEPAICMKTSRPVGLYTTQTLLLIAGQLENSPLHNPDYWFKSSLEGEIILNTRSREPTLYGDDVHVISGKSKPQGNETTCTFRSVLDPEDTLSLLIVRVDPAKVKRPQSVADLLRAASTSSSGTVIEDGDDGAGLSGLTHIEEEDILPDYLYFLRLTGVVLPRLSCMKSPPAYWVLSLNTNGLPLVEGEQAVWQLRANPTDKLEWRDMAGGQWQPLDIHSPLPFASATGLRLEPPALADRQFGILPLPPSVSIPIAAAATSLGRNVGQKNKADIPLAPLALAATLVQSNGQTGGGMEALGLSAEHIRVRVKGRDLWVEQLCGNSTHVVQAGGGVRSTLRLSAQGNRPTEALLGSGESLILGPLRFQYIEEFTPETRE